MTCSKSSMFLLFLLSGMLLLGELQNGMGVVACPQYCLDVEYITCTSSGDKKLSPKCNCCFAGAGCTLHLSDGTQQLVMGAVCPRHCLDMEYMTCTSSGDKKLSPKCNCCFAGAGCTLHLSDGLNSFALERATTSSSRI